jgi:hypothetical protein
VERKKAEGTYKSAGMLEKRERWERSREMKEEEKEGSASHSLSQLLIRTGCELLVVLS